MDIYIYNPNRHPKTFANVPAAAQCPDGKKSGILDPKKSVNAYLICEGFPTKVVLQGMEEMLIFWRKILR